MLQATAASGDAAPSPEAAVVEHERRAELLDGLAQLEERDREVLVHRFLLELGEEETAAALGVRRGTVKSTDVAGARASPGARGGGGGMTPLERELAALAPVVDWPESPDVAVRVARLAEGRPAPRRRRRLALVAALIAVAAVVATLAVPPARTAVLDWLGIGSARIELVDELPSLSPSPGLEILGDAVPLDEAESRAGFAVAAPPTGEPRPDEVRVTPGLRVAYLWRDRDGVRLLVTQLPGRSATEPGLVKKLIGSGTSVDQFEVDGDAAVWIEGGPHVVLLAAPDGTIREENGWLAGNTLLVDRDGLTTRVEGALTRDQAVAIVRAMRR